MLALLLTSSILGVVATADDAPAVALELASPMMDGAALLMVALLMVALLLAFAMITGATTASAVLESSSLTLILDIRLTDLQVPLVLNGSFADLPSRLRPQPSSASMDW